MSFLSTGHLRSRCFCSLEVCDEAVEPSSPLELHDAHRKPISGRNEADVLQVVVGCPVELANGWVQDVHVLERIRGRPHVEVPLLLACALQAESVTNRRC